MKKSVKKLHTSSSIQNEDELQDDLPPLLPERSDTGRYDQSDYLNKKLVKQISTSGRKNTT